MIQLAAKPKVLLFDVNETLLDIASLKEKVGDILLDPKAPEIWFATMLQYSLAVTVCGQYFAFPAIGAAVLRMLARNSQQKFPLAPEPDADASDLLGLAEALGA